MYLSSLSASYTAPWPLLGAYAATKAALDKLVEAWRVEQPSIGFTRLAVGDSFGGEGDSQTEFNKNWDPEALDKAIRLWMDRGPDARRSGRRRPPYRCGVFRNAVR